MTLTESLQIRRQLWDDRRRPRLYGSFAFLVLLVTRACFILIPKEQDASSSSRYVPQAVLVAHGLVAMGLGCARAESRRFFCEDVLFTVNMALSILTVAFGIYFLPSSPVPDVSAGRETEALVNLVVFGTCTLSGVRSRFVWVVPGTSAMVGLAVACTSRTWPLQPPWLCWALSAAVIAFGTAHQLEQLSVFQTVRIATKEPPCFASSPAQSPIAALPPSAFGTVLPSASGGAGRGTCVQRIEVMPSRPRQVEEPQHAPGHHTVFPLMSLSNDLPVVQEEPQHAPGHHTVPVEEESSSHGVVASIKEEGDRSSSSPSAGPQESNCPPGAPSSPRSSSEARLRQARGSLPLRPGRSRSFSSSSSEGVAVDQPLHAERPPHEAPLTESQISHLFTLSNSSLNSLARDCADAETNTEAVLTCSQATMTDIVWGANGWRCTRCARPPTLPGAPKGKQAAVELEMRGIGAECPDQWKGNLAVDGQWTILMEDEPVALPWLHRLVIHRGRFLDGVGEPGKLRWSGNQLSLKGRLVHRDGDLLIVTGRSGNIFRFQRSDTRPRAGIGAQPQRRAVPEDLLGPASRGTANTAAQERSSSVDFNNMEWIEDDDDSDEETLCLTPVVPRAYTR